MFLPPYSPELDPKENAWAWLKDYCARDSAHTADAERRTASEDTQVLHVRPQYTMQDEEARGGQGLPWRAMIVL